MKPYFSIIVPLYNKEKHIKDTLCSVWSQNFTNFEVIVVNDGSNDNSLEIVKSIEDKRLKLLNISNQGVSHARNYGISKSSADLIVFLDADDIWFDHHLEDLKVLYEQFPNCGLYCKAYDKKTKHFTIKSKFKDIPENTLWTGIVEDYFYSSSMSSIAWTSAVMIPKTTFEKVGIFNTEYNSGEDTDLWIRIALLYPVAFSNKVSAIHSLHAEHKITDLSLSSRRHVDFNKFKTQEAQQQSLKTYLDLNRYALALQYKLEGNSMAANDVYNQINTGNLSSFQKALIRLPAVILRQVLNSRNLLRRLNIDLRLFKR